MFWYNSMAFRLTCILLGRQSVDMLENAQQLYYYILLLSLIVRWVTWHHDVFDIWISAAFRLQLRISSSATPLAIMPEAVEIGWCDARNFHYLLNQTQTLPLSPPQQDKSQSCLASRSSNNPDKRLSRSCNIYQRRTPSHSPFHCQQRPRRLWRASTE